MTPRVFGCTCFIQDLSPGIDKLSSKSIKCVFVGYFRTQKGYQCYNLSTRKYLVSADVTFFESVLFISTQVSLTVSEIVPSSLSVPLHKLASTVSSPVLQQKLNIHMHQSQYEISDMSTLIAKRFLSRTYFGYSLSRRWSYSSTISFSL